MSRVGAPSISAPSNPPDPGSGEALVRAQFLSVDPYMRDRMRAGESYSEPWAPLCGGVVGSVAGQLATL